MSFRVVVPPSLREHAGGKGELLVDGAAATVAEALAALFAAQPALRDRVVGETGQLREHVNLFVDGESIRWSGGFDTPLRDGAELTILPALSGG